MYNGQQSEGGDKFTEGLGASRPNLLRYLEDRLREHKVSSPHAKHRAPGLRQVVALE
jgi:hypothetical protein